MSRKLKPVSPEAMLVEGFPKPLGLSNCRLAKEVGVPTQRIGEIPAGKRAITADTDLRLCRYFEPRYRGAGLHEGIESEESSPRKRVHELSVGKASVF